MVDTAMAIPPLVERQYLDDLRHNWNQLSFMNQASYMRGTSEFMRHPLAAFRQTSGANDSRPADQQQEATTAAAAVNIAAAALESALAVSTATLSTASPIGADRKRARSSTASTNDVPARATSRRVTSASSASTTAVP